MKRKHAETFVANQLKDLDVHPQSRAWIKIYENAVEGAEIMSKDELIKFIEELVELTPDGDLYE